MLSYNQSERQSESKPHNTSQKSNARHCLLQRWHSENRNMHLCHCWHHLQRTRCLHPPYRHMRSRFPCCIGCCAAGGAAEWVNLCRCEIPSNWMTVCCMQVISPHEQMLHCCILKEMQPSFIVTYYVTNSTAVFFAVIFCAVQYVHQQGLPCDCNKIRWSLEIKTELKFWQT